jgi:hypothetical protein
MKPEQKASMFDDYMKKRLGPILVQDASGKLKPDFRMFKSILFLIYKFELLLYYIYLIEVD